MNFDYGYDYEEIDRAYMTGKDDGGEQCYNVGYKDGYQDGISAVGGAKADTKTVLSGWVRTSERLPDGDDFKMLIVYVVDEIYIGLRYEWEVKANPDKYQYYIPMPKLPEVEG